jgi:hypothetical protein
MLAILLLRFRPSPMGASPQVPVAAVLSDVTRALSRECRNHAMIAHSLRQANIRNAPAQKRRARRTTRGAARDDAI